MNTARKTETKRDFYVPTITTTEPVEGKKIDLSFAELMYRKRNAKRYSETVRTSKKARRKRNSVLDMIGNFFAVISMFAGLYMALIVGAIIF